MRGSRRALVILTAATTALLLPGCRLNEAVYHLDGSRIVYMRPPLLKVVDELDERHLGVQSVVAQLTVILRENERNKEVALNGTYIGDNHGNLRLRIKASGGQVVLDMGSADDNVDVWLPRKGRFFQGRRQDLLTNSRCQLSLLAHAGRARDLFFPRAWSDSAVERRVTYQNGREVISVYEKPNFIRRRSRRITVAPDSACVETVEVYDKYGREVGVLAYSDYHFPDPDAPAGEAAACPLIYPGCIKLHSPDGLYTLELHVEELTLDSPIPTEKFPVPKPPHTKVLDMAQFLKHADTLWE